MYTDDDVRTPAIEEAAHKTDTSRLKELALLRPKAIDGPVVILHPVLLVSQDPVIQANQLSTEVVRFFDRADDSNRVGFSLEKTVNPGHDCRRRRPMAPARVGRDNQNLRPLRRSAHLPLNSNSHTSRFRLHAVDRLPRFPHLALKLLDLNQMPGIER